MKFQPFIDIKIPLIFILSFIPFTSTALTNDAVHQETFRIYKKTENVKHHDDAFIWEKIHHLSYVQSRLLRSFCRLKQVRGTEINSFLNELPQKTLPFEAAELLDIYAALPGADNDGYRRIVFLLTGSSRTTIKALHTIIIIPAMESDEYLLIAEQTSQMNPSSQWALKAILAKGLPPEIPTKVIIDQLNQLSAPQQWLLERIFTTSPDTFTFSTKIISAVRNLSNTAVINVMAALNLTTLHHNNALYWLDNFFLYSTEEQEKLFASLDPRKRKELMRIYEAGATDLIHEINRLHDVTDSFGGEISNSSLKKLSEQQLWETFDRLHPKVTMQWYDTFQDAITTKKLQDLNTILHQATTQSQRETVKELTSANLYVLLARGHQLYTSSFRNLLAPHLHTRIRGSRPYGLFEFLQAADPESIYTSEFISNLTRRGQLALFMPESLKKRLLILNLIEKSAFATQYSVLHFSISFKELLLKLNQQERSHFIEKMIAKLDDSNIGIATLVLLIFQDYIAREEVLEQDRLQILSALETRKPIPTETLTRTPFHEWLSDKKLSSLSIFQNDDDGYASYVSNNIDLLKNGYSPHITSNFSHQYEESTDTTLVQQLLADIHNRPYRVINELFHLSSKSPIIIDWKKKVGHITITHSTGVYQNNRLQTSLLKQFLQLGYEMYCQRGHSYWIRSQLQTPLTDILKEDTEFIGVIRKKQRFLSLGSCGSVDSYLELGRVFGNHIDVLATVGTGRTTINNMYNRKLFEIAARHPHLTSWLEVAKLTNPIFSENDEKDYLQPGSLPSITHKMIINNRYNDTH